MTKYIAHASIDEHSKIKGGKAGDQTKKEVCIRTWYNKPWSHVLRINNEKVRKQFGNNMIDIANNNNIGYDQNQRNSLLTQAIKVGFDFSKIKTKCECDCSSSITVSILGAIYTVLGKEEYKDAYKVLYAGNNYRTTSTLRSGLNTLKMITVYSDKAHVASTNKAVFGDIYISEGHHVVCYINDAKKVSLTTATSYYKKYTGLSLKIDTVFKAIGAPYGSVSKRMTVAKKNGYSNYKGTAFQNLALINLAKKGKLKK